MTLRRKTLLTCFGTLVVVNVLFVIVLHNILMSSFSTLEQEIVLRDLDHALHNFEDDSASMERALENWSRSDDSYEFIQDNNSDYVNTNLNDATFVSLNINLMMFLNSAKQIVYTKAVDSDPTSQSRLLQDFEGYARSEDRFLPLTTSTETTGFVNVAGFPLLIVSRPVLHTDGSGPSVGTLIWGQLLDSERLAAISESLHASLDLRNLTVPNLPSDFRAAQTTLSPSTSQTLTPVNETTISGYALLNDIYAQPTFILKTTQEREIYEHAQASEISVAIALGIVGVIAVVVVLLVLERVVFSPLERLSKRVSQIGVNADFSMRLPVIGNDELTLLSSRVNTMLNTVSQSRGTLRTLIDNLPDNVFVKDSNSRIIIDNIAHARLLGNSTPDQVIGKSDFDFFPHDLAQAYYDDEQRIIQTGESLINIEEPTIDPEGNQRWLQTSKILIRNEEGGIFGIVGINRDVTEQREAERELDRLLHLEQEQRAGLEKLVNELQQLNTKLELTNTELEQAEKKAEEASRAKSSFLANMSHELRTPLNAIIGYSELIEEECIDQQRDDFIPDLRKIQAAGKHLLALVNDILDLSKIEAGRMDLYIESINVPVVISDISVTIAPLMDKNANTLTVNCPADLGTIDADLTKIRQIIFNLLSNAAKFTTNGQITLDVSRQSTPSGDWIFAKVSDTGIGMTPAQLDNLFQDFSQADASTTRKYGGTGLGLSISRRFAQMMEGDITVESEYGKGTTFTLQLPAKASLPEAAPIVIESQPIASPSGSNTILVIDDDAAVRDLMLRRLASEDFRVETAASGQEGLQRARELQPDVIILDVMMPGMDGWAVLTQLKADPELALIPVVMMTMVNDKSMGFSLGASEYLTKPVEREQLVGILRKYEAHKSEAPILVVEDDSSNRNLIAQVLRKEGWRVAEAENGQTALEQVANTHPALILLDLMMPEMDGFEFIDELRKTESWRSIPIVVVTAMALTVEDRNRLTEQVQRILQKGNYSRDRFLEEVRSLVTAVSDERA